MTKTMPMSVRIWRKLPQDLAPDECWIWEGARSEHGYGMMSVNRRMRYAHRLMYELREGPVPEGLELDHLCRVRACVNPRHLEPVTHQENVDRGVNCRRTHCIRGHAYTRANTYEQIDRKGVLHRTCRTCRATRNATRLK